MAQPSVFLERMKYIKCRVVIIVSKKKITHTWLFNDIPRQSFSKLLCLLSYLLYPLLWLFSDYCVPIWETQTTYGLWDTLTGYAAALFHQSNERLLKQILAAFAFCTPNSSWFVTPPNQLFFIFPCLCSLILALSSEYEEFYPCMPNWYLILMKWPAAESTRFVGGDSKASLLCCILILCIRLRKCKCPLSSSSLLQGEGTWFVSPLVQKTSMVPPTFLSACLERGPGTIGAFLPEASYEWPYLLLVFVTKSCFVVVVFPPMQSCSLLDWPPSSIVLHETETAFALGGDSGCLYCEAS